MSREIPMLFKGPMVVAIKNGTKTETRRLQGLEAVNESPDEWKLTDTQIGCGMFVAYFESTRPCRNEITCRAKVTPGDIIWVKETFKPPTCKGFLPIYRATAEAPERVPGPWKPSIFMRREYSRIKLLVKEVRVERLQDIEESGAIAEGVEWLKCDGWKNYQVQDGRVTTARGSYSTLWDSINGKGSWAQNPWVTVTKFERVEPK